MTRTTRGRRLAAAPTLALLPLLAACGGPGGAASSADPSGSGSGVEAEAGQASGQRFPDVLEAQVDCAGGEGCTAQATISSPYDSPERYADAYRVRTTAGEVLGVRELTHDHAAEQPFTRTLSALAVPEGVSEVVVEGRDLANGWGGDTVTVAVQR